MQLPNSDLITRKDIARLLNMSVEAVRLNERRLGLHNARRNLNARCVRYRARIVIAILRARELID